MIYGNSNSRESVHTRKVERDIKMSDCDNKRACNLVGISTQIYYNTKRYMITKGQEKLLNVFFVWHDRRSFSDLINF